MEELKRRLINLEIATFGTSGNSWHSTGRLPAGTKTGKTGAMTHLTDDLGYPVSRGFHSIKEEIPGMVYSGQTGATEVKFSLNMHGIDNYNKSWAKNKESEPPPLIQGYTAENWDELREGEYLCEFAPDKHFHPEQITLSNLDYIDLAGIKAGVSLCRPAQLKGAVRPIWVVPENKNARFVFFNAKNDVVGWSNLLTDPRWEQVLAAIPSDATKYIEL